MLIRVRLFVSNLIKRAILVVYNSSFYSFWTRFDNDSSATKDPVPDSSQATNENGPSGTTTSTSTPIPVSTVPAGVNPYTHLPYSKRYFELFRKRIQLPVWEYRNKFFDLLDKNKILVLVGETGSGKTTQIPQWCVEYLRNSNRKLGKEFYL